MGWHSLQSLRTTFGDSRYLERRRQRQTYCSKESPRTRQHFKSWKVGSFKLSRGRSRGLPSAYPSLGKTGGQEYTAERCPQTLLARNISLCLQFVPSRLNQADAPSRVLSDKDCMLAPEPWKELENLFGRHTFDLMAFDSNAQIGCSSSPLPHFTPFPTPDSRGVNVFAQDEASQEDTYVFLPFILVLFSVFSTRPCSRSPLWFQNYLLDHIGGLLFKQGHLILSSWAIKLITISCYFHLCTTFFPHVLYLGICMLSGLPTRFRLSFL